MKTPNIPPILYNLKIQEIEVLASPLDRAQALTFSPIDPTDEHTRALIRSVRSPEAGETGAALQRLLDPVKKPPPRPRRKPSMMAMPVGSSSHPEQRGSLEEAKSSDVPGYGGIGPASSSAERAFGGQG